MTTKLTRILVLCVFVLVSISLAVLVFIYQNTKMNSNENDEEYDTTVVTPSPMPTPDPNWKIPANWSEFKNEELGISFSYPGDKKPLYRENKLYFILPGPSQSLVADFYDGINITIIKGRIEKPNLTLRDSLEPIIEVRKTDPFVKEISQILDYKLNGVNGYKFTETIESGKNIRIYLSRGGSEYLIIYFTFMDPHNKDLESTGQKIIDSMKFL